MDLGKIFEGKDITESSKKLYIKNLQRLAGSEIKSLSFLKSPEEIMKKLEKYKPNTQRTYIISIVSLLKCTLDIDPKNKKLFEKYSTIMDEFNKQLKSNTAPTEKETANWMPKDELDNKRAELITEVNAFPKKKELTESQFEVLQKTLLLSLYTLQRPRRNVDYQQMMIVKKTDDALPTDKNYLFLDTNKFLFNRFKTEKKYTSQTEDITPEMKVVIDLYIKLFPLAKALKKKDIVAVPFICNYKGEAYTNNNDMTRLLYKVFDGKKVGSSMYRKMFLTEKYGKILNELKDDTTAMGTSTNMAENHYVKDGI